MLYDLIRNQLKQDNEAYPVFRQAEIFDVTNVAKYFYDHPQTHWDVTVDFPNIAPPFPIFWMEYEVPKYILVGGETHKLDKWKKGYRTGVMVQSIDHGDFWLSHLSLFWGGRRTKPVGGNIGFVAGISKETGQVMRLDDGKAAFNMFIPQEHKDIILPDGKKPTDSLLTSAFPFFLAISFLHCKNVRHTTVTPKKSRKSKHHIKHPSYQYHVLKINRAAKAISKEAGSDGSLSRSLHICRGHFRDYTKSGLFGRIKGIFWVDSHIRGNANQGVVEKDYEVNP